MVKQILTVLFLFFLVGMLKAQNQHPLLQPFQNALQTGELQLMEPLLDAEVSFRLGNTTQSLSPKDVLLALTELLKELSPQQLEVRHQGESASGQLYAMGRLVGNKGMGYSWMMRARAAAKNEYRIIQLELDPDD